MIVYERVLRFYEALGGALHDRSIEDAGQEVQFYFDADVAIDTIVGLTSWNRETLPDVSPLTYVVRALLSTGWLPTVRFLRPHLLEMEDVLKNLPDTPMMDGFHKAAMNHLIRQWQLSDGEEDLRRKLREDGGNGFFEFVREHGYGVFVKLELCLGGTWRSRLRNMLHAGQFNFAADGPVDSPRADTVATSLSVQLSALRSTPQKSFSNQIDAYALAELSRKVRRGVHARFYTETDAVRQLFHRSPSSIREVLSIDGLPVERSEEYFLIRSSFPALGFSASPARRRFLIPPSPGPFSLDFLQKLHGDLHHILYEVEVPAEAGKGSIESAPTRGLTDLDAVVDAALREVPAGDSNLGELIERFYSLGFLDSVFLSWSPPEMQRWTPSLYDAKSQPALVADTRRKLTNSLDGLWVVLDREVGQLRNWRSDFIKILGAAERRSAGSKGLKPRVNVELGFGRWGIEELLDSELQDRLEKAITGFLEDSAREANASNLAISFAFHAADVREFSYEICVLWFLGLDDLMLRRFSHALAPVKAQLPPWLELLRCVAEVKTVSERSRGEALHSRVQDVVDAMRRLVARAQAAGWDEGFAEMGLAHVYYWAWKSMGADTKGGAKQYAVESFKAAERAQSLLDRGSLGWAFAVNHSAYIALRAQIFPTKRERALQTLHESIPKSWSHYRFTDTEVRASTEEVNRLIGRYGSTKLRSLPSLAERRREICEQLSWGYRRLQEQPHWGDVEVVQHLNSIRRHLDELECGPFSKRSSRASSALRSRRKP